MQLKHIELTGFKSFADKTELEFVKGITAVVGPNGSGKSNISDAIRWVLGEQSARSLRGGRMEDIIFGGSDTRRAVNYGEVSITFDNSGQTLPLDFTEVTVTRRLHRSGDSEYFINKQACRLKDITELFMDTGIGKEAYSIIGQGRIEEILSTKSEDRRLIFEEAAGIVKYKSRKREAERKLEDTEQNLLRIHDLISELEDQRGPLWEQSQKAKEYKRLQEQLKSLDISLYVFRIQQAHQQWQEATAEINRLSEEQIRLSTIVSRHDAQLETQRLELRRSEEELEQLNKALLEVSQDTEKTEGLRNVLLERQRNMRKNLQQLEQTGESLTYRLHEKKEEWVQLHTQLQEIEETIATLQLQLNEEQEKLQHVAATTDVDTVDELNTRLLNVLNSMTEARHEIQYAKQESEVLYNRFARVKELMDKNSEIIKNREQLLAQREHEAKQLGQKTSDLGEQAHSLTVTLQEKEKLLDESQQNLRKWEQRVEALTSRKDTMEEMYHDYDGYAHGVKEVLKMGHRQGGLRGIHGAVADLLKVSGELESAIETALGGALQHVVVASERDGREAIAFLKKKQLGRATFLPLDVIRGRSIPVHEREKIKAVLGFIGIASELVQFDDEYESIMTNLLGNVIIAGQLEQANRIAASCQYRFRVVTLDGDVVNPGGSMSGGSRHNRSSNLLGRQRIIEELTEEIKKAADQVAKMSAQNYTVRQEIADMQNRQERIRVQLENSRVTQKQLDAEYRQLETQIDELKQQRDQYVLDGQEIEQQLKELDGKRMQHEQVLQQKQQEETDIQLHIQEAETHRRANLSAREELHSYLTELKVKLARAHQQKQTYEEHQRKLQIELATSGGDQEQNQQLKSQIQQELSTIDAENEQLTVQFHERSLQKREMAEQIEFKRADRAELHQRLQREEDKTKEQRQQLKETEEQLHRVEVSMNRLDVELDNLLKKLSEEYALSFELAQERYPVPEDVEETTQKVKHLKREISLLGDVNLGAIEEYDRINERFEFLQSQQQDLLEAKTALYRVIAEMDEEMSKRFRQTFDAIRSQFVVVFTKLFGGGRADLILTEPERLLTTGIEIIAQPPGKKLQNLQLLSGGERALTAIALLFSILRIKPVPFCVLDEVEAALDEANVSRFAEYLREFSMQTQFIVVTHRKGTMEEADVLYGVTMEEGGVSKLVSVRLDDDSNLVSA